MTDTIKTESSAKPPLGPKSAGNKMRRNAMKVAIASLLSRVSGLAREVAFAAAFGASAAADAFLGAFRVGNLFRELLAEGALANAFVPMFADVSEKEGLKSGWRLANAFLGVLLLISGVITIATLIFAEPLIMMVAGGFAQDPNKLELATNLTRILAPFIATISAASVFMGMLNVRGKFFLPAIVPMVYNALVILACVGRDWIGEATGFHPIYAVAVAALLGGAGQALVQLPALKKDGYRLKISFGKHPALKRLLKFVVPAIIAISVVQVNLLIETQLASREGDGPVAWLIYSFRIAHLPMSVVSGAVGVAALAGLSILRAKGKTEEFRQTLAESINLNSFLLLPAAICVFIYATPAVKFLFERGAFTPADTAATASMLQMYAVALLGIGIHRVMVPIFYALDDPMTPMWAGLATVALKYPVAIWLVAKIGVDGLPLSHAILVTLEIAFLLIVVCRRVPGISGPLVTSHLKAFVAGFIMVLALWQTREMASGLAFIPLSAVGCGFYLLLSSIIGVPEAKRITARLVRGPRPPNNPTL